MSANPFLVMLNVLKAVIAKVAPDLLERPDIGPALKKIDDYRHELEALPGEIAKIKAEKARVEARLPSREAAAKPARHDVRLLEEKLAKLRKSLDHNLASLAACPEPETAPTPASVFGLDIKLPATRKERVEELKTEMAEVEKEIASTIEGGRKAESLLKSDVTRVKNLARKLEETTRDYQACLNATSEMAKLVKKTADHLKNRQAHHDRRAADRLAKLSTVETPVVEASKAPTDEQLRTWAELVGLDIASDDDLVAARDLHQQTAY